MQTPDVIPAAGFPRGALDQPEPAVGPELWPIGLADGVWIVLGIALARLLLLWS